ncbi:hypothetical protein [Salinispora tropica]|uniref:hypothetical protein n=1 Tax=Salinispora tropica TaxID=168695 RepID=UPI00048D48D9|nr:hypothetical protein [Salinispora tropica]
MIIILVATNTIVTVLGQVRLTRHVTTLASTARATMVSAVLLAAACLTFALSGQATAGAGQSPP